MEFFSERNNLIDHKKNIYTTEFRRAIVNSFFNQYKTFQNKELLNGVQEVMDMFGIEQKPSLTDDATLLNDKNNILNYFKTCSWNYLFDFVEFVLALEDVRTKELTEKYNRIFRMHGCKYRLVNGRVVPLVNELEIKEISKALNTGIESVDAAYNEAISLLADRNEPDYNAVIAKASNALESMVLTIAEESSVNQNTLSRAINELENNGIVFDQDMKAIIKAVYNYACNAGIRHGGTEPISATEEDAILVMVICATTINYLNSQRFR